MVLAVAAMFSAERSSGSLQSRSTLGSSSSSLRNVWGQPGVKNWAGLNSDPPSVLDGSGSRLVRGRTVRGHFQWWKEEDAAGTAAS